MEPTEPTPNRTAARLMLFLLAVCGVAFAVVVATRLRGVSPVLRVMIVVFEWLVLGLVARMVLRPRADGGR